MMKHIHFIGIGGTGLSAIARVLIQQGYEVSGSDMTASDYFLQIGKDGAKIVLGHKAENVLGADMVIRSSAIKDTNPEVIAALAQGIPVLKRSEFLPILLDGLNTIAVAGSHGKTTTTAMVLFILNKIGVDPSFIVGANVKQLGTNAHAGTSQLFVIEADEYDYMFLGLNPLVSVITNIEHDHPDCFPTLQSYLDAFVQFARRLRSNGTLLVCSDDGGIRDLIPQLENLQTNIKTYGFNDDAIHQANNLQSDPDGYPTFDMVYKNNNSENELLGKCKLQIPGKHNVLNGLAALSVIHTLGLSMPDAINALADFTGTERRFDIVDRVKGITFVNDYAHHPTQITSTIAAAKAKFPGSRIWAIWEPHTYSRTASLARDFSHALADADLVVITQIYAAREADTGYLPIDIVDDLGSSKACFIPDFLQVVDFLIQNLVEGDVVLVLSAGNAPEITELSLAALKDKRDGTGSK